MLQLRPLSLEDLDACYSLEQAAHTHPWTRAQMLSALQRYGGLGLQNETGLQAFAVVSKVLEEAELLDFVVAPGMQGQGIGVSLLTQVIENLSRSRLQRFYREVRESNEVALTLYRNAGFAEVGVRRGYYPAARGREDAVLMAMQLI